MAESTQGTGATRRREERVRVHIPLSVHWTDSDGEEHETSGYTRVVNRYGCLLVIEAALSEGTTLVLENASTHSSLTARVVGSGRVDPTGRQNVLLELGGPYGIELESPDPAFWGPEYLHARQEALEGHTSH